MCIANNPLLTIKKESFIMAQGIRSFTNARFAKFLPQLPELGNTKFRKKVMDGVVTKFGISVQSAATHYNHALKQHRIIDPKAVAELGRPEDKKGGRKAIHTVTVVKARSGAVVAEGVSRGQATLLISKAEASGKPKLKIAEDATA
jgi:hypothetical protein